MKATRSIVRRWIISGQLELVTPAHLSNGDPDPFVDLPIFVDPLEGLALLTGSSLAGALRSYVDVYTADTGGRLSQALFGGRRRSAEGEQSPLIVDDALGPRPLIEFRDGVSIDAQTRTAADEAKYDRQLIAAGTTFALGFELLISAGSDVNLLRQALVVALAGLQAGEIRLGGRKRRGLGECRAGAWQVWDYDLTTSEGLQGWLIHHRPGWPGQHRPTWTGADIRQWPEAPSIEALDKRSRFRVAANFDIDGSLLIRSGFEALHGPDVMHLQSQRDGQWRPILAGTSLAGVLRAQAGRIARTLGVTNAEDLVRRMFGHMPQDPTDTFPRSASRITVSESVVSGDLHSIVQSRVKIDRFTGGAVESALFSEQPIFGGQVQIQVELQEPTPIEVGLLLLILKDLWTGHVPLGGGASVGRGRLKGNAADLTWQTPGGTRSWRLQSTGADGRLSISGDSAVDLTACIDELTKGAQR